MYQLNQLIHKRVVRSDVSSRPKGPEHVDGFPPERDHHEGHGGRARPWDPHLAIDQNLAADGAVLKGRRDELIGNAEVWKDHGIGVVPKGKSQVLDATSGVVILTKLNRPLPVALGRVKDVGDSNFLQKFDVFSWCLFWKIKN